MGQVLSAATTRRISGSGNGGSGSRHAGGEGSRNKQEMPYRLVLLIDVNLVKILCQEG